MKTRTPARATFGAGCFWCVEAVFERLDGVSEVVSGYMGGAVKNPSYEEVCEGATGHAEVVQITFDLEMLDYESLLAWFFRCHDPTTRNRQGADSGTQYRSVVFFHDESQRLAAAKKIACLDAEAAFPSRIVTEVTQASDFYPAGNEHQDFYRRNSHTPYCMAVIAPKIASLGMEG